MPETDDIGNELPSWAAACFVFRMPQVLENCEITIKSNHHLYLGQELCLCSDDIGTCKVHGCFSGSMNETMVGDNARNFREQNEFGDANASYSIHGKDIFKAQRCMMRSKDRLRHEREKQHEDEMDNPSRKPSQLWVKPSYLFLPQEERNRGARAHRVALSMREESAYISGGKYKPSTLMGLPAELHLRIMEIYFHELKLDGKAASVSCTVPPSLYLHNSRWLPITKSIQGERFQYPLAILQTSRLLYAEGLGIFQKNAMFVSEYQPIGGLGDEYWPNNNLHTHREKTPKMWPGLKRWWLRITTPDQGRDWGVKDFPFDEDNNDHMQQFRDLMLSHMERHLSIALKNGNQLDELIVDIGTICLSGGDIERIVDREVTAYTPDTVLYYSRFLILKSLLSLKGKVKKLVILGALQSKLDLYAQCVERFVQGYEDTSKWQLTESGPFEKPADQEFQFENEGTDDDFEGVQNSQNISNNSPSLSIYSDVPSILMLWIIRQNWTVNQSGRFSTKLRQPSQPVNPGHTIPQSWYEDTNVPPKEKMLELAGSGAEQLQELGIYESACLDNWLEIRPWDGVERLPNFAVREDGPEFLHWPNSDVDLAAGVNFLDDQPICFPLIAPGPLVKNHEWEKDIWVNFSVCLVLIGNPTKSQKEVIFNCRRGVWWHLSIPKCFFPRRKGFYIITGINGLVYPTPTVMRDNTLPEVSDEDKEIDALGNLNPFYDGPEDDGLDWPEDDIELDVEDRLDGEVEIDNREFWNWWHL